MLDGIIFPSTFENFLLIQIRKLIGVKICFNSKSLCQFILFIISVFLMQIDDTGTPDSDDARQFLGHFFIRLCLVVFPIVKCQKHSFQKQKLALCIGF